MVRPCRASPIEVTANLGALPGSSTAYLYVFDDDGQHSSPGFSVELNVALPAACEDGQDHDADGLVDYPDDPGCSSPDDDDESVTPKPMRPMPFQNHTHG